MSPGRRWLVLPALALLAPQVLASAAAARMTSQQPQVLGRWSVSFFLLLVVDAVALLTAIWGLGAVGIVSWRPRWLRS